MVESNPHQQIGYILRSYPRLSQTFILNEILMLEQLGLDLEIFAIVNPREPVVQAQVAEIHAPVHYLETARQQPRMKIFLQHLWVFWASPIRYLQTVLFVLQEHKLDAGYHACTRVECFRMAIYLVWLLQREEKRSGKPIRHLHAHFAHDPALIAFLASRLTGRPYSFTAHARDLYQLAAPVLAERAKGAKAVVTCCKPNLDYLHQVLPEELHAKIKLIHHGVDLQSFQPAPVEAPSSGIPLVLTVGRLIEKKGIPDLLEAYLRLKQAGVLFRGEIYGEGPLCQELAEFIHDHGLEGQVILAGARRQQELIPLYQKATAFVLTPSVTEDGDRDGIPNSLVEAMACGLPVVSTCTAGIPEVVIHDYNGLLFEPHDADGIASGLISLLCDETRRKRLGAAALQTVVERFDLRAGARQMADLFAQIGTV